MSGKILKLLKHCACFIHRLMSPSDLGITIMLIHSQKRNNLNKFTQQIKSVKKKVILIQCLLNIQTKVEKQQLSNFFSKLTLLNSSTIYMQLKMASYIVVIQRQRKWAVNFFFYEITVNIFRKIIQLRVVQIIHKFLELGKIEMYFD